MKYVIVQYSLLESKSIEAGSKATDYLYIIMIVLKFNLLIKTLLKSKHSGYLQGFLQIWDDFKFFFNTLIQIKLDSNTNDLFQLFYCCLYLSSPLMSRCLCEIG